jgi:hypothetical protein
VKQDEIAYSKIFTARMPFTLAFSYQTEITVQCWLIRSQLGTVHTYLIWLVKVLQSL